MKIFVLGVPHTQTREAFNTCAFTMKVRNLCRMMRMRGHEVIHLGVEGSDPDCTENVNVMSRETWERFYGHPGASQYNTRSDGEYAPYHAEWAANARAAIESRCREPWEAILCCTWGGAQQTAVQGLSQFIVESGIGYRHTWAPYRVFESYAWMHQIYGSLGWFHQGHSDRWYDAVIPNAFDPEHFEYREAKDDYFLFLGRLNEDKGVRLAIELAGKVGRKIIVAGQGEFAPFAAPHAEYVGPVGIEQRRQLLAGAKALLCPTRYIEPFGGVAVEAQMSGTPVICTDWGAFPETVQHGVTGFRCRTFGQFVHAAESIERISPANCYRWAWLNYSLGRVGAVYEEYFRSLLDLRRAGWYEPRPAERGGLGWLYREHNL